MIIVNITVGDTRVQSFSLNGTFHWESVPLIFHWFFCKQNQQLLSTCGACLEVVIEIE
jgi:hypothetical protein